MALCKLTLSRAFSAGCPGVLSGAVHSTAVLSAGASQESKWGTATGHSGPTPQVQTTENSVLQLHQKEKQNQGLTVLSP